MQLLFCSPFFSGSGCERGRMSRVRVGSEEIDGTTTSNHIVFVYNQLT